MLCLWQCINSMYCIVVTAFPPKAFTRRHHHLKTTLRVYSGCVLCVPTKSQFFGHPLSLLLYTSATRLGAGIPEKSTPGNLRHARWQRWMSVSIMFYVAMLHATWRGLARCQELASYFDMFSCFSCFGQTMPNELHPRPGGKKTLPSADWIRIQTALASEGNASRGQLVQQLALPASEKHPIYVCYILVITGPFSGPNQSYVISWYLPNPLWPRSACVTAPTCIML